MREKSSINIIADRNKAKIKAAKKIDVAIDTFS